MLSVFCNAERLEQMRHEQNFARNRRAMTALPPNLSAAEIAAKRAAGVREVDPSQDAARGDDEIHRLVRGEIEFEIINSSTTRCS